MKTMNKVNPFLGSNTFKKSKKNGSKIKLIAIAIISLLFSVGVILLIIAAAGNKN